MYILDKLILIVVLRYCLAYKYISINNKYNKFPTNKNNTIINNNKYIGYDHRFSLVEDTSNIYNLKVLNEKKKLLNLLKSNICNNEKINLIEDAKLNNILKSNNLIPNILNGGLMDDYNFKIN